MENVGRKGISTEQMLKNGRLVIDEFPRCGLLVLLDSMLWLTFGVISTSSLLVLSEH